MKRGQRVLNPGMRGFILIGNRKEELFTREAITIFNEHYEKYNSETETTQVSTDDADRELSTELGELKDRSKSPFREVRLNIRHTTFIQCDLRAPDEFLLSLFADLKANTVKKTRYVERVLPVTVTTSCRREEISRSLGVVLQPFIDVQRQFPSFAVVAKITNNDVITKGLLNEMAADILTGWTLAHDRADITVLVNVFRGLCCLSVVRQYDEYCRYNVAKFLEAGT